MLINDDIKERLIMVSKRYDNFKEFSDEIGWEDWMSVYWDDDFIEYSLNKIENILYEIWKTTHVETE